MIEKDIFDMDEKEAEAAFMAAKAHLASSEIPSEVSNEANDTETDENFSDAENLDNSQDSGHNEVDDVDEKVEEASSEESPLDNEEDSEEKPADEAESKTEATSTVQQKFKYRANGKEYEFTQQEIMEQFPRVFGQAMDYTRKMQAIKPWRKTIDALEQNGIAHEDISLMIDVLKGDKAAIAEVLKRTGVDTLDLETADSTYTPKNYGRDDTVLAIKDVIEEIGSDPEYSITHRVLTKEWDSHSWNSMSKDPQLIKLLHYDIKSGIYNKIQPIAEKLKLFDGNRKSDLEYYGLAAQEYQKELTLQAMAKAQVPSETKKEEAKATRIEQAKKQEAQRKATETASAKRKAAAPTRTGGSKPQGVTDYLDDSDEAFEEWYRKLKDSL